MLLKTVADLATLLRLQGATRAWVGLSDVKEEGR